MTSGHCSISREDGLADFIETCQLEAKRGKPFHRPDLWQTDAGGLAFDEDEQREIQEALIEP